MRVRNVLYVVLTVASATACEGVPIVCAQLTLDACQKAEDVAYMVSAQRGDQTATGNVIVGEGGALHVPGAVTVAVRVSGVRQHDPRVSGVTARTDGQVGSSTFGVDRGTATPISFDVAVGALPGFRVGNNRVGGVDVILGAGAPAVRSGGDVRVKQKGFSAVSGALRVGLLSGDGSLPALTLTGIARDLPSMEVALAPMPTTGGGTATIGIDELDVSTLGVRLAASKRLGRLSLTGGVGRDRYRSRASFQVNVREPTGRPDGGEIGENVSRTATFKITRNTAFGGVSWTVGRAAVSAELGRVTGGPASSTLNRFAPHPPNAARGFVTLGVTLRTGRTDQE